MPLETIIDLTIDTLVHGGRGLGHHAGKAVFVPLTAPGDRVHCRIAREKKSFIEADLVEVLEPSSLRREPPCHLFGACGGCQWQHLGYADQAHWKARIFSEQLSRARVAGPESLLPLRPAPAEFHYRNRVQFKCRMTTEGFVIGFYRSGSHFVVDVDRCLLVRPPIQQVLTLLRHAMADAPAPDGVPQIDVTCGDNGRTQLVVHVLPAVEDIMADWLGIFARQHDLALSLQVGRKMSLRHIHGETDQCLHIDPLDLELRVSPGGFAQINPEQNRALVEAVCQLADLKGTERVLDLFCGMGNFSLPLARNAGELDGVEAYAPAIDDARRNALANGLDNTNFHAEDATGAIGRYWRNRGYDLVVLDPPRTGCYPVVRELLKYRPERIIYVSCDPATLARDLLPLVNGGYQLMSSQPFDLFPQTWHIESVTSLRRADPV